jgi:hypothetical protein
VRVVRQVFGRVSAPAAELDTADEGDSVIDHALFLMSKGLSGVLGVGAEVKARRGLHTQAQGGQRFTFRRKDDVEVPGQQVDVQMRMLFDQRDQKCTHLIGEVAEAGIVVVKSLPPVEANRG